MVSPDNSQNKLILNPCADVFKKPLNPAPKRKTKILDEETYLKKLESIIERDFFPELKNFPHELEFLDTVDANDICQLRELYSKYCEKIGTSTRSGDESPSTFDTPELNRSDQTPGKEKTAKEGTKCSTTNRNEDNVSLDEFVFSYTSEDNESFRRIMKEGVRKMRLKYAWLYEAEANHKSHLPNLELPSLDEQKQARILAITGTANKEKDTRPTSLENWDFKIFNSVMFVPDGSHPTKLTLKRNAEKEICHKNTRFSEDPFKGSATPSSALETSTFQTAKNQGKIGVDGKMLSSTPTVKGFKFMRTPSPHPGVDCSPLMTWGDVEGTPLNLDGSQTPQMRGKSTGPSYKMPQTLKKDEVLLRLSEKHNQSHRNRRSKAFSVARSNLKSPSTPSHMSNLDKRAAMSPAAQKLLSSNKIGIRKSSVDRSLRASYTPSPSTFNTPNSARFGSGKKLTPSRSVQRVSTPVIPSESLTDNLLCLPREGAAPSSTPDFKAKRKCAADFFDS